MEPASEELMDTSLRRAPAKGFAAADFILAITSSSGIVCAGAREFRRVSASPRSSNFLENEAGLLVHFDQKAAQEIAHGQTFARFPARRGGVSSGCADCC
jgi:hypothetical protein